MTETIDHLTTWRGYLASGITIGGAVVTGQPVNLGAREIAGMRPLQREMFACAKTVKNTQLNIDNIENSASLHGDVCLANGKYFLKNNVRMTSSGESV